MRLVGRPIFEYPAERVAPAGEGCPTCGIILEADQILGYCSPECIEYEDRCGECQRGPTWCECEHYGIHLPPERISPMTTNDFTNKEKEDLVASMLTDDDLRARSQALNDCQETWEELAYLANPKMPCPECTGAGAIIGGSLGDICPRCLGMRVIDHPGSEPLEQPDFRALRAGISAYGDALADRALPDDHRGRRRLSLPPASSVVTMESINALHAQAKASAKALGAGAPGLAQHNLPAPKKATGLVGEEPIGDFDDGDLDEMEEADRD